MSVIEVLIFNACFNAGLYWFIYNKTDLNKYSESIWSKPLYSCIQCMSSLYGVLFYFVFVGYDLTVIPYIFALIPTSTFILRYSFE